MASYSKTELVMAALREIGVAQRDTDVTADELVDGCARLDAMMADWDGMGIHVGWPIDPTASPDPSLETGLQPSAVRAVVTNLALELAPGYGRPVQRETVKTAKAGLTTLQALASTPPRLRLPGGVPLGQGNRQFTGLWPTFTRPPAENITVGDDSTLDFD